MLIGILQCGAKREMNSAKLTLAVLLVLYSDLHGVGELREAGEGWSGNFIQLERIELE